MNKNWDTPFVSGSGLCYPSKDYSNVNNLKGGKVNPEGIIKTSFGGSKSKKQRGGQPLDQSYGSYPPEESLTGSLGEVQDFQEGSRLAPVSDTKQCGGKKQKQKKVDTKDKKKKQRGGQSLYQSEGPYPPETSLTGSPGEVKNFQQGCRLALVSDTKQAGGKKKSSNDKKKKQRGGQSLYKSEGPYPPEASLTGSPGEVKDFQEGSRLALVSDTKQMGGNKKKKVVKKDTNKKQRGGQSLYQSEGPYPPEASLTGSPGEVKDFQQGCRLALFNDSKQSGGKKQKKVVKKDTKKKQKGGDQSVATPMPPQFYNPNVKGGKKMRGGMESSGATPMHPSFYDPNIKLENVASPSGIRNVGTVDLVPTMPGNTLGNVMKTGGSKSKTLLKNRNTKGGRIPYVNDPSPAIRSTINSAIDGFSLFMRQLDQSYLNSVKYFSSLKTGGKKESRQKESKKKESKKKQIKQKETKKRQKGGDGSDFALTLSSRGPVNAPDAYWGVDGETWFRQFNKSGDYIPNSQLPQAATPLLAGDNKGDIVVGFDEMGTAYGKVDF